MPEGNRLKHVERFGVAGLALEQGLPQRGGLIEVALLGRESGEGVELEIVAGQFALGHQERACVGELTALE